VLSFQRIGYGETLVVFANTSGAPAAVEVSASEVLFSTHTDRIGKTVAATLTLHPDEAVILQSRKAQHGR